MTYSELFYLIQEIQNESFIAPATVGELFEEIDNRAEWKKYISQKLDTEERYTLLNEEEKTKQRRKQLIKDMYNLTYYNFMMDRSGMSCFLHWITEFVHIAAMLYPKTRVGALLLDTYYETYSSVMGMYEEELETLMDFGISS